MKDQREGERKQSRIEKMEEFDGERKREIKGIFSLPSLSLSLCLEGRERRRKKTGLRNKDLYPLTFGQNKWQLAKTTSLFNNVFLFSLFPFPCLERKISQNQSDF